MNDPKKHPKTKGSMTLNLLGVNHSNNMTRLYMAVSTDSTLSDGGQNEMVTSSSEVRRKE